MRTCPEALWQTDWQRPSDERRVAESPAGRRWRSLLFSRHRIGSQARPCLIHRVSEWLAQLVDHRRRNVELAGRIWLHLISDSFVGCPFVHDLLLEHPDAVYETLWPWRAARDVDINGNDRVDSLHHC